jgi:hypothetical protein
MTMSKKLNGEIINKIKKNYWNIEKKPLNMNEITELGN